MPEPTSRPHLVLIRPGLPSRLVHWMAAVLVIVWAAEMPVSVPVTGPGRSVAGIVPHLLRLLRGEPCLLLRLHHGLKLASPQGRAQQLGL